jgi:hypothetical protein
MPVSEHEAALAAARQVDEAMVKRVAEAISDGFEQGYRTHWCAEWDYEPGSGCDRCREVARAALLAAPERGGELVGDEHARLEAELAALREAGQAVVQAELMYRMDDSLNRSELWNPALLRAIDGLRAALNPEAGK